MTGNDTIGGIKFPTVNALQDVQAGSDDAFVTKFDPQGNVLFSTIFGGGGGTDNLLGLELDKDSNIVITGWTDSDDFPTVNAFQSSKAGPASANAFVAKLNSAGNQIPLLDVLGRLI